MADRIGAGPDPDEITAWIQARYDDVDIVATENGAGTFFSCTEEHWPNFATIVTTDEFDMGNPSNLARPGVFRLNIGIGRASFERLVGGVVEPDDTALDALLPHPVYAKQRWVAILNPGRRSFDELVKPLLDEAHGIVSRGSVAKG